MQSWGVCVSESQVTSGKLFLCVFYSFSGERLCILYPMLKGVGDSVAGHSKAVRFLTPPSPPRTVISQVTSCILFFFS